MHIYSLSPDIKGSRRPFFRDEFEEWIEHACSHRTSEEGYISRYEKQQEEFFDKMNEEGIDLNAQDVVE